MEEMKPCPFCHTDDELYVTSRAAGNYSVECGRCGAQGPVTPTEATGYDLWDKR